MKKKRMIQKINRLEMILNNFCDNFVKCRKEMLECGCRGRAPYPYFSGELKHEDWKFNK